MKKKITVSVSSLVASSLLLILIVIGICYVAIFHLGITDKVVENDKPNVEKVHEKSNEVVISEIKPKRE